MERSDAVELGIAIGSVGLFILVLAVIGTVYGAGGATFDGTVHDGAVQGEATFNGSDVGELNGTVDGDLQGSVNGTDGGAFNGTLDASFNGTADGSDVNGTISGSVDGALSGPDNGTIEGSFSGTLNGTVNATVTGTISGTADGSIHETDSIAAAGAMPLVGGILFFVVVMAVAGLYLSRQDS
ncbi:MAG: hypothetical protein V5A27_07020 [Halapricum sp.]